jgi:hypothetical protein
MKTYDVTFYVTSEITRQVQAEDESDALDKAIADAVETEPKVEWLVDEYSDHQIDEVN